jgi:xanthine permease XanP
MAARPTNLIYGVDDVPSPPVLLLLALQHIFLMSSTLVLPIVLVTEISGDFTQTSAVVALTMISCGIGTVLQACRWRGIGSGFLCPNLCGPNFFAACMSTAWLGGLPLMRGMTIAAGLIEIMFARLLHRLAFMFPAPITGLVVFMVALSLVPVGSSKFLHVDYAGEPIQPISLAIAAVTLMVMVGINIWSASKWKLYGLLIGLAVGYALSAAAGLLDAVQYNNVGFAPWIGLPDYTGFLQISFDWKLLPVFAIVSICGALKSFGNLVMCEKVNDDGWTEPDIDRIGGGLVADGIAVTISGLLGGVASDTSASNVGLSSATGATSRWIGVAAGTLFALLGFSPKLSAVLSVMPSPVAGAVLIFVVCFMIMAGVQIILSSKPDARMTFVIGISMAFGLSLDIAPELYAQVPFWVRPLFDSSLTLATVLAVLLHQVFRLGAPAAAKVATEMPSEG